MIRRSFLQIMVGSIAALFMPCKTKAAPRYVGGVDWGGYGNDALAAQVRCILLDGTDTGYLIGTRKGKVCFERQNFLFADFKALLVPTSSSEVIARQYRGTETIQEMCQRGLLPNRVTASFNGTSWVYRHPDGTREVMPRVRCWNSACSNPATDILTMKGHPERASVVSGPVCRVCLRDKPYVGIPTALVLVWSPAQFQDYYNWSKSVRFSEAYGMDPAGVSKLISTQEVL